jgi:uncharacterized cupredoxin-like copper-binding protein
MRGTARARLTITALALIAMAAVGGALALASGGGTSEDGGVVTIAMRDGAIEVERPVLPAGRTVFEVVNEGATEHEAVVLRTDRAPDELPVGLHGVSISLAGDLVLGEDHIAMRHGHRPGETLGLNPGRSLRYQVDLKPGDYVVYCQTGTHYLAGERAAFSVE